jgi:hypothetical protein
MKGRANHVGPESCVSGREAWDEALTGVPLGQVLSRERLLVRDADAVASPSNTQGGSSMREIRPYGSVRGAHREIVPTAINLRDGADLGLPRLRSSQ